MARVAILGTEGSGKTVLMTVLANRFKRGDDGIRLTPLTKETSNFVAQNWDYLRRCDWPPSTREGVLKNLYWELHVDGRPDCTMQFHEISGQDFRFLFADGKVESVSELAPHLKALAEHVRSADICVFLVNLDDFVGQPDAKIVSRSQSALFNAIAYARSSASPRRCSIVFTQEDKFVDIRKQSVTWETVVKTYLPNIFNSFVSNSSVSVMGVAAVGNVVADPNSGLTPRRIPATHWRSLGLEALMTWIGNSAHEIEAEKVKRRNERKSQPRSTLKSPNKNIEDSPFSTSKGCLLVLAIPFLLSLCIAPLILLWTQTNASDAKLPLQTVTPWAVLVKAKGSTIHD